MHYLIQFGPWAVGAAITAGSLVWHYDRKQLIAFYDAHTTAKQREVIAGDIALVRPLAEAAVPFVERQFASLPGAEKFVQAVNHVLSILADRGVSVPAAMIQGEVQRAYGIAKANGTLAASTPKAATPATDSKPAS